MHTNLEYRKGFLFIRLDGILNESTTKEFEKNIMPIIKVGGIKNIAFNLSNLIKIEKDYINIFIDTFETISSIDGKVYIINVKEEVKNVLELRGILDLIENKENELELIKG